MAKSAKSAFCPSADQIAKGFEHVLYEIRMFLESPKLRALDWAATNAITEAYLLHARILCDFFQKGRQGPKHDDVTSEDYGVPFDDLFVPASIEERFDKSLAHLTYSRLEFDAVGTKQWIHDEFRPQILRRSHAFLSHVVTDFEGRIPPDLLSEARQLCAQIERETHEFSIKLSHTPTKSGSSRAVSRSDADPDPTTI
jgi:hypothetical protein